MDLVDSIDRFIVAIHVISVVFWISSMPVSTIIRKISRKVSEDQEKTVLGYLNVVSKIIMVAALMVFLTGGYLAGALWFNFSDALWLALKQVVFFGLLVALVVFLKLRIDKLMSLLEGDTPIDEIRKASKSLVKFEHSMNGLVIINILLAYIKPFI